MSDSSADDVLELGLDEALGEAIAVIEWPERLGQLLPPDRLDVLLDFVAGEADARTVRLSGAGAWVQRLAAIAGDVTS